MTPEPQATGSTAARVAAFVAERRLLEPGQPVLALVSGGADSMCLWGVMEELGHSVAALHVDHGLRGEASRADAAYCAERGAEVVAVDLAAGPNLEARARAARYAQAHDRAAGRPIVTGHTLSDQAETVLYRLASSSGPRAVRAIRASAGGLVRPLLCLTAAETRAWCGAHAISPCRDATNDDQTIRRNLIRAEVIPALRRVHPGVEHNLARSAELLGELDELLGELAREHLADPVDLDRLSALPRALRMIVLREAAERAAGRPLRLPRALSERLERLACRRTGHERLSLARDLEAVRERSSLRFAAPAVRATGAAPTGYPGAR
ncbi:MAG TPA: tRNA lysidine(34) synthetase TilS [Gaiellales bacterium]|nr:tRNA lysidine(34) synthetase TilS [Gaiellales bacterium]